MAKRDAVLAIRSVSCSTDSASLTDDAVSTWSLRYIFTLVRAPVPHAVPLQAKGATPTTRTATKSVVPTQQKHEILDPFIERLDASTSLLQPGGNEYTKEYIFHQTSK